jgi:protein-S-isoprenylcysteine O-methyltransferase Ste14
MGVASPRVEKKSLSSYAAIFVIMPIITYIVGNWVDKVLTLPKYPPFPFNLVFGFSIFAIGLGLGIKSTRLLYMYGAGLPWGEARTIDQSSKLVTTGLYAYTRNPMVLGYSMLPVGMGFMFQSMGMATIIPAWVLFFNLALVKLIEEPKLVKRFGDEYLVYRTNTPMLIPRMSEVTRMVFRWRGGYFTHVLIPLISLALLVGLTYGHKTQSIPLQKEITAIVFVLICILGAITGIYPRKMSKIFKHGIGGKRNEVGDGYSGHHPDCRHFLTHKLTIRSHRLCAGCTGLVIGAVLGAGFTLFILPMKNTLLVEAIFWIGFALIIVGVLQHTLDLGNPIIHAGLNAVLVLGVSMARFAAESLNGGVIVAVYSIALTLYLVIARIELSQNVHRLICGGCMESCERSYAS